MKTPQYKNIREFLKKEHPDILKEVVKDNFTTIKQVRLKFEKNSDLSKYR